MSGINLFAPKANGTVSLAVTATTGSVSLSKPASAMQVRVKNIDSANIAYINFGTSTVVATVPNGATPGSLPLGPGETAGFTVPEGTTHIAAICSGALTATIFASPGNGM